MHSNKIRTDSSLFRKLNHMFPDAAFPKPREKEVRLLPFFFLNQNIHSNCYFLKQKNQTSKIVNVTRTVINNDIFKSRHVSTLHNLQPCAQALLWWLKTHSNCHEHTSQIQAYTAGFQHHNQHVGNTPGFPENSLCLPSSNDTAEMVQLA